MRTLRIPVWSLFRNDKKAGIHYRSNGCKKHDRRQGRELQGQTCPDTPCLSVPNIFGLRKSVRNIFIKRDRIGTAVGNLKRPTIFTLV